MKAVAQIIRRDFKAIFHNISAIIVLLALCVLPSLYAWFNIKACWDPYSPNATRGIKIGVVNLDNGININNTTINIGDKVIEGLKDNHQLGWQVADKATAREAVEEGKYFAMITIPENFTENLTSILSSDVKQGEIIYTVNEKINAIAPKLTDKGASGIQETISKQVVETTSKAIFEVAKSIGVNLEKEIPKISEIYHKLVLLQSKFGEINNTVENTDQGLIKLKDIIREINDQLPTITQTILDAQTFVKNTETFLVTSKKVTGHIGPVIRNDLQLISELSATVEKDIVAIHELITSNSDNALQAVENLATKLDDLSKLNTGVTSFLQGLNHLSVQKPFTSLIDKLDASQAELNNFASTITTIRELLKSGDLAQLPNLDKLATVASSIHTITSRLYDNFDSSFQNQINAILDSAYQTAEGSLQILQGAQQILPDVTDFLKIASSSVDNGVKGIEYVKKESPKAEAAISNVVAKLGNITNEEGLQQLINLLKADVQKRSNFLTNPVEIKEERLFPMSNYGTSMTPFYTVLCLWVGALLLVSILTVEVKGSYTSNQVYFSKLFLFTVIVVIQAVIVSLGDLYLLKIYCVNKGYFILSNIFIGLIFMAIVYSLVSVLGNIGKVIAIILLVLQVAGSGGTFPIELTPKFFQNLYPFLPFTYAIGIDREVIGGIVERVLVKDIGMLVIYGVVVLLISVLFKKPLNNLLHGFIVRFKESGLGE